MSLRPMIPDHVHGNEPDSDGPVPRDPPPTDDMPEEVKEPSSEPSAEPEEGEADDSETDGEIQETPD